MPNLVLTRRQGEDIKIGSDVTVRVASIVGDRVRLAVTAPLSVRVDRSEVRAATEAGKRETGK